MPAHPDNMAGVCGRCHGQEVGAARSSRHFTLSGEIGTVWSGFFPGEQAPALLDLPVEEPPRTEKGLVSDLLRRRCLRCHVYYRGDNYRGTSRGTGCAACHLRIRTEGPWDHRFYKDVPDSRCLSCHYGNFVGWDYYGRFDTDFEDAFRAPFLEGEHIQRPYGMEWHDMTPDVHKLAGMGCTDCHCSGPCQGQGPGTGCLDCHLNEKGSDTAPIMNQRRIGHRQKDLDLVACAACHAVWAVQDRGRSLIRQDSPDYDDWSYLAVQGDSEIETTVKIYVDRPYEDWTSPGMLDKISGRYRPGLWFECFTQRRWGPVELAEDSTGRLTVVRPIMDLSLSYVDSYGNVLFDKLRPIGRNDGLSPLWLPYSPHTTGSADTFRTIHVRSWLQKRPVNSE